MITKQKLKKFQNVLSVLAAQLNKKANLHYSCKLQVQRCLIMTNKIILTQIRESQCKLNMIKSLTLSHLITARLKVMQKEQRLNCSLLQLLIKELKTSLTNIKPVVRMPKKTASLHLTTMTCMKLRDGKSFSNYAKVMQAVMGRLT